jgi:ABC-2 type transport system permease protein
VKKEWLVLLHDWHALLLLFAMPVLFILVMSLALRDRFATHRGAALDYYLIDSDDGPESRDVAARIRAEPSFRALPADASEDELARRVTTDKAHFLVVIPAGFSGGMTTPDPLEIRVRAAPGVEPAVLKLFESAVRGAVLRVYTERALDGISRGAPDGTAPARPDLDAASKLVRIVSSKGADAAQPSSVQQNVPAWLVFAMFFIALPLSTTWVQERQQGTFARLKALGVSRSALLIGKMAPYFAINLLQVVSMLLVGMYVVPMFGGDALALGDSKSALALMALAVSFASVSYGLLVANVVATTEQATIFTGVANLLLAVIGGIMVPRFVMPAAMQDLSLFSPMAWGLEGFLDVLLRHGDLARVVPWALRLFAFGLASLAAAAICLGRVRGR